MESLPDDCLILIFQKLNCSSDRESLGLTCNRWLKIQNINRRSLQFQCSFTLLHRSSLFGNNLTVNTHHLRRLLYRFQHLHHLSLSGCTELTASSLTPLEFYGSDIESLHLDCCFGIRDEGMPVIARGCSTLKVLSLYRCFVTDAGLEALSEGCIFLTNVNLSYCANITDVGMNKLVRSNRQIRAIRVSFCRRVTGSGLQESSSTLSYVDAESCSVGYDSLRSIFWGGGVEFLNISGVTSRLAEDGLGRISMLRILNLRMCKGVGDEFVARIAQCCPLLEEWSLSLCGEVGVAGWGAIGRHCKALLKLHAMRCRRLSEQGLQEIGDGCPSLALFYVTTCGQWLSPAALMRFKHHRRDVLVVDEEVLSIGPQWFHV